MADRIDPNEKAEVKAFIRELYASSGCKGWAEFARAAKVSELSLSDWRSAKGSLPGAINLLKLIRAVPQTERAMMLVDLTADDGALTKVVRRLAAGEKIDPQEVSAGAVALRELASALALVADRLEERAALGGAP